MSATIMEITTLTVMTCATCGIQYALPEGYRAKRAEDGRSWKCPNDHSQVYRKTELDRMKETLERAEAVNRSKIQQLEFAATREKGLKIKLGKSEAAKKRIEARVYAGVCPCCNRTFKALARHMATQHADDPRAAIELEKLAARETS